MMKARQQRTEAIRILKRAVEIGERDHKREEDIIWFDFGSMEQCVKNALAVLDPPKAKP